MIPLFRPSVSQKEIDYVTKTLKSGWWGLGGVTAEFEKRFAEFVGVKYAVAVNSATTALELALRVHGITDGEVIVPALTFVSTALVALHTGNKVVFADIDPNTLCIDWNDVQKKVTDKTKAIMPVHYGGKYAGNFDSYRPLKPMAKFTIIEDAAHATGNSMAGKKNTACWSFHAVKNLATGDGGMITTNDEEIYQKLQPMRWCGIDKSTFERSQKKYGWDYQIETIGYKSHMNDITASIGLAQLERLPELNMKRKMRVLQYLYELKNERWITLPDFDDVSNWHMFVIRVSERDTFIDYMLKNGISAGVHYKPLNNYKIFPQTKLPVTDRVWKTLVTLPLFPDMTDEEFNYIIKTIRRFR